MRGVIEGSPYIVYGDRGWSGEDEIPGDVSIRYEGETGSIVVLKFTTEQAEDLIVQLGKAIEASKLRWSDV